MKRYALAILFLIALLTFAIEVYAQSFHGHVWIPVGTTEGRSNLAIYLDEIAKRNCVAKLPALVLVRDDKIHPHVYDVQYSCPTSDVGPWVPDGASPAILMPTPPKAPAPAASTPTPTVKPCFGPDPFTAMGGGICVDGGWRMR